MLTRRSVYVLLAAFGGLQLALSCRTSAFVYDSYYYELARSILARSAYGFNSRPEPMIPPGFPALLALLVLVVGNSYAILIRSMALFTTFGLIAAYEILESKEGRIAAGAICLLLASSPALFEFSSRMLFSDMPYFLTSMVLLWALTRLDSATNGSRQLALWWASCALLLLASILLRSTGIALAGGIAVWLVVSQFREREPGRRRLALFVPLVVLGLAAEAGWVLWSERHPVSQWPVHGFQESYVAQLKLKNGNDPELGLATWQDVLKRPIENEDDMATSMVGLFTHKQVAPAWYSPVTVIPLALLLIGLSHSFWRSGGEITEWYFVNYQCLFLFWPWNFELRFQLPIAPLAVLYMWRGGGVLLGWTRRMPRTIGIVCAVLAAVGFVSSAIWGRSVRHPSALACIAIWILAGCLSALLLGGGQRLIQRLSSLLTNTVSLGRAPVSRAALAGGIVLMCLVAAGTWMQVAAGLNNLHRVPEMNPNIEAAEWIRDHSADDTVVMARWEALVYHYSGRRVIWFPASTDPQLLLAGIRHHHIGLIVVTENEDDSYWKPSDTYCFRVLLRAYPSLFSRVHEGAHEQVYEVRGVNEPDMQSRRL